MIRRDTGVLLAFALAASGCLDSLVDDPCAQGYVLASGRCVERPVVDPELPTGPTVTVVDPDVTGPPDGPACTADLESDPLNCGACGIECASGLCTAGRCDGALRGHVVAIGHDYRTSNAVMRRVLANAAALGARDNLTIAHWTGASLASAHAAADGALALGLAALGRPWHVAAIPTTPTALDALAEIDVVVVDPQSGDGAAAESSGATWAATFDAFLDRGGVVVTLESAGGVTYRFAAGARLFDVAAPVEVTGAAAVVADAADAVALAVPSPYAAAASSVAYPTAPGAVIATGSDRTVVFHLVR